MIYITGDTHGDLSRFRSRAFRALGAEDVLIVLGDFGFLWDGGAAEQENRKWLAERPYRIFFLDGCHENYSMLGQYPVQDLYGGRMRQIGKNMYHVCRGSILHVQERTLLCMGGGESEDPADRQELVNWWPEEMPTEADLTYCARELNAHERAVDYVLSYDAPETFLRLEPLAQRQRPVNMLHLFLDGVRRNSQYRHWYIGRYHLDCPLTPRATLVFQNLIRLE